MGIKFDVICAFTLATLLSAAAFAQEAVETQIGPAVATTEVMVLDENGRPAKDEKGNILFATVQVGFNLFFSPALAVSAGAGVQLPNEAVQAEGFIGTQTAFDIPQLDAGYRLRVRVHSGQSMKTYLEWEDTRLLAHDDYYVGDTNTVSVVFQSPEEGLFAKLGIARTKCYDNEEDLRDEVNSHKCHYLRVSLTKKF